MQTDESSRLSLLPVYAALAVVAIFLALYNLLDIGAAVNTTTNPSWPKAERAKLLWGVSALSLVSALLWNLSTAAVILRIGLRRHGKTSGAAVVAFLGVINLIGWVGLCYFNAGGAAADSLIKLIETHAKVPMSQLTFAGNLLAFTTVSVLVMSVCSIAAPVPKVEVDPVAEKIKLWTFSLYSAAGLLVVALFEIYALFKWGAAVSGANQVAFDTMADALAVSAGVVFTVLLIAIYGPVAVIQHQWLDVLIADESRRTADLDVSKWLARHGLQSSPLTIGAAMFAPLLSGALTSITKLFA